MKRNCDEMNVTDNDMHTDNLDQPLHVVKKLKDAETKDLLDMKINSDSNASEQMLINVFKTFVGSGQHNLVERDANPAGHSLVNPMYTSKTSYETLMELDMNFANASQFVVANMGNKVDQIGRQMKHLHENLQKVFNDGLRDSELHSAACNFVKKAGHLYHLYERTSGQKYFSMLSPEDWTGNPPHKFLGSFYLESDQSWTPLEERLSRFEGVSFIKQLMLKKSIQ